MARSQRYGRILSAAKYYAAIDNYIKYVTDSTKRGSRVGSGQPRAKSKKLYLTPFGVDLSASQRILQSGNEASFNTYSGALGARVSGNAPSASSDILKLSGYKAARVMITTGRSATGVAKTSKVTGMKYLSYGGKTTSLPFGKTGTETQLQAFTAIRTAVLNITAGAIVSLQEEVLN